MGKECNDTGEGIYWQQGAKSHKGKQVCSNDLLYAKIAEYFRYQRFSNTNHLGLGDIRLTIGQQEEVLKMVAEDTNCEYRGI